MADFAKALEEILAIADKGQRRSVHRLGGGKPIDLPSLAKGLASKEMNNDRETQRIAELLQTLSNLNKAVTYTMVQEQLPNQQKQVPRILCVIHVHGDQTFLKFQNIKTPEAMNLFRGFCIELNGVDAATMSSLNDTMPSPMDCDEEPQRDSHVENEIVALHGANLPLSESSQYFAATRATRVHESMQESAR